MTKWADDMDRAGIGADYDTNLRPLPREPMNSDSAYTPEPGASNLDPHDVCARPGCGLWREDHWGPNAMANGRCTGFVFLHVTPDHLANLINNTARLEERIAALELHYHRTNSPSRNTSDPVYE